MSQRTNHDGENTSAVEGNAHRVVKGSGRTDTVRERCIHALLPGNSRDCPRRNIDSANEVIVVVSLYDPCKVRSVTIEGSGKRGRRCDSTVQQSNIFIKAQGIDKQCALTTRANVPNPLRATPMGLRKVANVPTPSEKGEKTPRRPESVVTAPVVILYALIRWLLLSDCEE
jgi:hypothetical protein